MAQRSSELAGRIRRSVRQWFYQRAQECVHCFQCGAAVTPWESHCRTCGQRDPAKLSRWAVVSLLLAFLVLALVVSWLLRAF